MAEKQTAGKRSPGNRGHYTVYTPEQKAEIGRYAAEHGNLKSVCTKFSEELGLHVKESTVRQFKKAYFIQLNEGKEPDQIKALRGKKRGRPSKVGLSPLKPVPSGSSSTTGTPTNSEQDPVDEKYEQTAGELAISTCLTNLINGDTGKPLLLIAFCSDGKLESQELSSVADVQAYPDTQDLSLIPDEICLHTVCMMVGMNCLVDQSFIDRCPKLKIIISLGLSCDNIDLDYVSRVGVVVCNVPDMCIEETADSAFSLILSLFRQTAFLHSAVLADKHVMKVEDIFSGAKSSRRIRGKTLGLLGLGKTGIALAQRAKGFGFNIIFYDPSTADGLERAIGGLTRVTDISDLLTKSDCISLHCELNEETKHIINDSTMRLFKKGSFLINVTHNQLVDEVALAKALRTGKLAGAGIDVFDTSSYKDNPLRGIPNLITTPRVSWYSRESYVEMRGVAIRLIHQALFTLDGSCISNCVNSHILDADQCRVRWTALS